jgi:hypothetical protein
MVPLAVATVLVGCDGSLDGSPGGNSEPMGRGNRCNENLAAVVDEDYLLENGLEVRDPDAATIAVGGAIAEVCVEGPSSTPIEEGAQRVVEIVRDRNTS